MSSLLTPLQRDIMQARTQGHLVFEGMREAEPHRFYLSHDRGQRQFHQAAHIIRALWPGNGFGKTRAMGTEFAWWIYHCHPYQRVPKWPIIAVWCAETYKQYDILREQLQTECFGPERSVIHPNGWKFNKNDKCYFWPTGDRLFLISGDSSWTHIQGINPDLMGFDEEPPRALFNEARMRRRGRRKTRYCFAATATQGLTWMYQELYLPWLEYHTERGLTFEQALERQMHPIIWGWPTGGGADNPGLDAGDVAYYQAQRFASEAERRVRLFGGFADFSGTPVFDQEALERMRPHLRDGQTGSLVPARRSDGTEHKTRFEFIPDGPGERGRVTIYEHPDLTKTRYVIGHDSAYGLEGKDFDYAVVLDRNTGRQVAEAQGRWGDVQWAMILYALYWYYGQAFLVGERQVGLITMRRLYDEMGVGFQYFDRNDASRARRRSDTLGHFRRPGDLIIRNLRRAIGSRNVRGELLDPEITVVSKELHRQLVKYQFSPRRETLAIEDARDADLATGAPPGDHDDGVMALAYAHLGMREVEHFKEPPPQYEDGTYGKVFEMDKDFRPPPPKPADPFERDM